MNFLKANRLSITLKTFGRSPTRCKSSWTLGLEVILVQTSCGVMMCLCDWIRLSTSSTRCLKWTTICSRPEISQDLISRKSLFSLQTSKKATTLLLASLTLLNLKLLFQQPLTCSNQLLELNFKIQISDLTSCKHSFRLVWNGSHILIQASACCPHLGLQSPI